MSGEHATEAARRMGVRYPIVQGPFGGGLSTARLAATVSNMGGLGSYGAHDLAPQAIGRVASEIRALTSLPFAMNLWVHDRDVDGVELSQGGIRPRLPDLRALLSRARPRATRASVAFPSII